MHRAVEAVTAGCWLMVAQASDVPASGHWTIDLIAKLGLPVGGLIVLGYAWWKRDQSADARNREMWSAMITRMNQVEDNRVQLLTTTISDTREVLSAVKEILVMATKAMDHCQAYREKKE